MGYKGYILMINLGKALLSYLQIFACPSVMIVLFFAGVAATWGRILNVS